MASDLPIPPPGFDELDVEAKLDYVQSLWSRIIEQPEDVPVPEWHRVILRERLDRRRAGVSDDRSWDDVRRQARRRLRRDQS